MKVKSRSFGAKIKFHPETFLAENSAGGPLRQVLPHVTIGAPRLRLAPQSNRPETAQVGLEQLPTGLTAVSQISLC
jgi:hypothetical protein